MKKILINIPNFAVLNPDAHKYLQEHGYDIVFNNMKESVATYEEILPYISNIDAVIVGNDAWNDKLFKQAKNLKVIAKFGVGVDSIDLVGAKKHGIKVVNAPGQNADAVAEFAVGLALDAIKNISHQQELLRNGHWSVDWLGQEIKGKTVGLYGFGNIARKAAVIFIGFGATVIACDSFPNYELAKKIGVGLVSPDELLTRSDIVSIHIPNTKENYHVINRDSIAKMKDGAYFINTARGGLVDTDALCDALDSGKIRWASLDVYEKEPAEPSDRIVKNKHATITPHIAGQTHESWLGISMTIVNDIERVLNNEEPKAWVNKNS
jgi:D-3-phosphoglycerate dehydrogenase / 2-oxoglutarate reductase